MLQGSRIEKIQDIAPGHLNMAFYAGGQKRNLCLRFGRQNPFCFLTATRPQALPTPTALTMRLRKHFANRRIASVVTDVWGRKLWLMASQPQESAGKTVWLCLDLAEGPSVYFLDVEKLPFTPALQWPPFDNLASLLEDWRAWPMLTPALRKTIAGMDGREAAALLADLEAGGGDVFAYANAGGRIVRLSAWPLPPGQYGDLLESARDDILPVFEQAGQDLVFQALFARREKVAMADNERRALKLRKLEAKFDEDEKRLRALAAQERDALALAANLWRLPGDEKRDSVEVGEDAQKRTIALDRRFSVKENMGRLFHAARRGKRGLRMLADRRAQARVEAGGANTASQRLPAPSQADVQALDQPVAVSRHVQAFTSPDGYRLLCGRDARGNQDVRKMASGYDLWAHVREGPGAHVVIRRAHGADEPPETTLLAAGRLAARKSWLAGAGEAEIMLAEVRHVKPARSGPPGKVVIDKLWRVMTVDMTPPAS